MAVTCHRDELPRRMDHLLRAIPLSPKGVRREISTPAAGLAQGVFPCGLREFSILGVSSTEMVRRPQECSVGPQVSALPVDSRAPLTGVRTATPRAARGSLRGEPSNLPDVPRARSRRGSPHDHSRFTHEDLRQVHRRRRRHLHRPPGTRDRLPRPQRRRQVDDHARHGRAHPAHVRRRHHLRSPLPRPAQPRPRGGRAAGRLGAARRPHRTGDPHHHASAPWACPSYGSRRCWPGSA